MPGYVPVSRVLVAVLLALLVWADLTVGQADVGGGEELDLGADRTIQVASRGGPRLALGPKRQEDVLAAYPTLRTPSPTPLPLPTPTVPPAPTPTPEILVKPLGTFRVSGYSDSPRLNGTDGRGITRSGQKTRWGVVAVDPGVIPLGSQLMIEGMDGTVFTALDTGGAVIGRKVDVWFASDWEALQHGVKQCAVYLVQ